MAGRLVRRPGPIPRGAGGGRAAIVLHSLIGLLQLYSFSKDQFPLLFLYVNPSFSVDGGVGRRIRSLRQAALRSLPRAVGDGRVAGPMRPSWWPAVC